MKRLLKILLSITVCLSMSIPAMTLTGCGEKVFRISNCEDYIAIDEELGINILEEFEEYYKEKTGETIKVEYTTFGTLEELYTNMKRGDEYDLVCPSDYMIEKMAREGMLQPLNLSETGTYNTFVSPYIKQVLESVKWGENNSENLAKYSAGYMWGTLGLVYNDSKVSNKEDMKSWASLWENTYRGRFTIKNSVRDTYFIGLAKHFNNQLIEAKEGNWDYNSYQMLLSDYFNNTNADVVKEVEELLIDLKQRSWGLEVDSGKNDIINGDIDVYFAWSGDAVYAIDEARNSGVTLNYEVPEEGSNIWFDGWCVPKQSENLEIAKEFIDFISRPSSVKKNMEYIGYTSCIAGTEVFNYVKNTYNETYGGYSTDLSYFFGNGDYVIKTSKRNGQFNAQYPSEETIKRCVVMNYFDDQANDRITKMWAKISIQ